MGPLNTTVQHLMCGKNYQRTKPNGSGFIADLDKLTLTHGQLMWNAIIKSYHFSCFLVKWKAWKSCSCSLRCAVSRDRSAGSQLLSTCETFMLVWSNTSCLRKNLLKMLQELPGDSVSLIWLFLIKNCIFHFCYQVIERTSTRNIEIVPETAPK